MQFRRGRALASEPDRSSRRSTHRRPPGRTTRASRKEPGARQRSVAARVVDDLRNAATSVDGVEHPLLLRIDGENQIVDTDGSGSTAQPLRRQAVVPGRTESRGDESARSAASARSSKRTVAPRRRVVRFDRRRRCGSPSCLATAPSPRTARAREARPTVSREASPRSRRTEAGTAPASTSARSVKPLRSMKSNSCGTEYDRSRGFSSASASASAFAASRDPRSSAANG